MRLDALQTHDRFFNKAKTYTYDACETCHTIVLWHPEWTAQEAYPDDYPAHAADPSVKWFHRIFARYFFPALPGNAPDPVVEIGAGTGQFLAFLKSKGRLVSGYEMDAAAVARARRHGLDLQQGTWESFMADPGTVGVLIMNQVIEHLVQPPDEVFSKVFRALKPGGIFLVRTPNAHAWGRYHFGSCWHPLEVPRHTVIYSWPGILRCARAAGFEMASARCCGRWYDVGQSAKYKKEAGQGSFWNNLLDMRSIGSPVSRVLAVLMNVRKKGDSMEWVFRKPASI